MNKNLKRGLVLAASIATITSAALATPALAHDRGASAGNSNSRALHNHATVSATITGIPTSVSDPRAAHHGAYFTVYKLDNGQTTLPASRPTTGGMRMGVHPSSKGSTPTISSGTLTGVLKFRGEAGSTIRYAVYPSSGGSAALVTVVTNADGVATATASTSLTASYSQSVADAAPTKSDMGRPEKRDGEQGRPSGHMGKRH